MPCLHRSIGLVAFSLITCSLAHAQDPPKPREKVEAPAKPPEPEVPVKAERQFPPVLEFKEEIKPLPLVAIPDDPPPHEGAFFDLPVTIEPSDIIIVEVLEAMAGRPITGERLIRPDGTISLGFYGDVHVRGLTLEQAKAKIVIHLRKYLLDEVLGLVVPVGGEGEVMVDEKEGIPFPNPGRNPFDLDPMPKGEKADPVPEEAPPAGKKPESEAKPIEKKEGRPSARLSRRAKPERTRIHRLVRPAALQDPPKVERRDEPQGLKPPMPEPKPGEEMVVVEVVDEPIQFQVIPPADSHRVFVDISSFNTKVYYVQGDVGVPGRLPWTGKETVLDALNYAGGFVQIAEPTDIHLYRPARGGKPAKDYKIDLEAIHKGVATANLQLFPNDRLIVGRNPVVKKTIEVDRAAGLINSMMNSTLQYSFTARSMAAINAPPSGGNGSMQVRVNGQNLPLNLADPTLMSPARRDALVKDWAEFLWSISSKEGGAMLDENAFKDALMKKLTPSAGPK